jgi:hypothetical protein
MKGFSLVTGIKTGSAESLRLKAELWFEPVLTATGLGFAEIWSTMAITYQINVD